MQCLCVFERVVNPQGFFTDVGTKCEDAVLCEDEVFSSYSSPQRTIHALLHRGNQSTNQCGQLTGE